MAQMTADPRTLARRTLALAGDDPVQVTVTCTSTATLPFTQAGVQDPVLGGAVVVHVLVLRQDPAGTTDTTGTPQTTPPSNRSAQAGGHAGVAVARGTSDAELAAALGEATADAGRAAARGGGRGSHPGLPVAQTIRPHDGYDPATARHEPAAAQVAIAAVLDAARDAEVEGTWTTSATETAIASSAGLDLHDRVTRAVLDVVVRDPASGLEGAACGAAVRERDLDAAEIAARALSVLRPGDPSEVAPGPLAVVLGPEAVAAVLVRLGQATFNGLAHVEGHAALAGLLGCEVAAPAINLSDSPRYAGTLPAAFDLDGVAKGLVPLIGDGVAHRVVHDLRSAARAGGAARSTGHATAPGGAEDGPRPQHLVLSAGEAADVAELCAPIASGLFVSRLSYHSKIDDEATTMPGALRIEDGRLAGPAAGVSLDAAPLAVLRGTEALTATQWLVPDGDRASVVTPALRTSGLTVIEPS